MIWCKCTGHLQNCSRYLKCGTTAFYAAVFHMSLLCWIQSKVQGTNTTSGRTSAQIAQVSIMPPVTCPASHPVTYIRVFGVDLDSITKVVGECDSNQWASNSNRNPYRNPDPNFQSNAGSCTTEATQNRYDLGRGRDPEEKRFGNRKKAWPFQKHGFEHIEKTPKPPSKMSPDLQNPISKGPWEIPHRNVQMSCLRFFLDALIRQQLPWRMDCGLGNEPCGAPDCWLWCENGSRLKNPKIRLMMVMI